MSRKARPVWEQEWRVPPDAMLAYAEWRFSCTAVWAAYACWSNAGRAQEDLAHSAYKAALDREDAAAHVYAQLVRPRAI
ncbi:MAG TPA: hypothetical protein VMA77_06730 [Solirubrobacteraceae bacterium]|nr:hypothetical protein [Solirubrobacteraceae bacterium]